MSAYQSIKVSLIDIPADRLREVDQDWAECLAGMFAETGQKTPIDVVVSDKRFILVAGAHRLTAAKLAKWKEIDARVLEPQGETAADDLRLHEILENLGRKNFNPLERCEALHEMKRIYEALHPEAKHGGKRGNQHTGGEKRQVPIFGFCQNAAEKTGFSRSAVALAVQIFDGLTPETRERLKGTALAEKQSDLKALSVLEPQIQADVLNQLLAEKPTVGSIADAVFMIKGRKKLSDKEKRFKTVCEYLPRLSPAIRTNVFRQHKKEIIALVKKEGWLDD